MIQILNEKMDQTQNHFIQSHDNLSLKIFIRMKNKIPLMFFLSEQNDIFSVML